MGAWKVSRYKLWTRTQLCNKIICHIKLHVVTQKNCYINPRHCMFTFKFNATLSLIRSKPSQISSHKKCQSLFLFFLKTFNWGKIHGSKTKGGYFYVVILLKITAATSTITFCFIPGFTGESVIHQSHRNYHLPHLSNIFHKEKLVKQRRYKKMFAFSTLR